MIREATAPSSIKALRYGAAAFAIALSLLVLLYVLMF